MSDSRMHKRTLAERKDTFLTWRQGKFSAEEISKVEQAIAEWQRDKNLSRAEAADQLRWARDSGVRAWCDIAHKSGLIFRKIQSIRTCALRHCLSERRKWTAEENAEFKNLQETLGATSWKAIAQELGRTLEEVQNKGKSFRASALKKKAVLPDDHEMKSAHSNSSTDFCDIAAAVVESCTDLKSQLIGIHGISWATVSQLLTGSTSFSEILRHKWRIALTREIDALIKQEQLAEQIDQFIIWKVYLATKGLVDNQACPAEDFEGVPWIEICPFFPVHVSRGKLRDLLARFPARENFTKTVKQIAKTLDASAQVEPLMDTMTEKVQGLIKQIAAQRKRPFNLPQLLD